MFKSFTSFIVSLLVSTAAYAAPVLHCDIGNGHKITIIPLRTDPDIYSFHMKLDGRNTLAFEPLDGQDYVQGEIVLAVCKKQTYTLVVDYGPPYLKGFTLRSNPATHKIERIDFAEKRVPVLLVNKDDTFKVVMPNGDSSPNSRYIVYTAGKELPDHSNDLPAGPYIKLK